MRVVAGARGSAGDDVEPTAMQFDAVTHDTPLRARPTAPGLRTSDQRLPFHTSVIATP